LIVSILFFAVTEFGRHVYRPFIYSNDINDFGIADSIGNLGGIVVQIFFSLALLNSPKEKAVRVVVFIVVGYCLYEVLQPYLPRGVFDWKDIYGTFLGGIISYILVFILNKVLTKNKIIYQL